MQRRALFGQAAGQRRFRRAGDVGFPLIPIERTEHRQQIALGPADSADAVDIQNPSRH